MIIKMLYRNLFLNYLEHNRWYSYWTIRWYSFYLKYFDLFLKQKTNYKITLEDCEKISKIHIENFINNEALKWKNPRTINVYISAIKQYLTYCESIWKNICNLSFIKRVKEYDNDIQSLNKDESNKLLSYFKECIDKNPWKELLYKRNYCICYLLLYTWLRLSELHNLKISQIWEQMLIKWKWRKNRIIYLFDEDLEVINSYLRERKDNSEWLFISLSRISYWEQLSRTSIETIIKEWWKESWIWRVFPHKLRHTFATNLLRNNANLTHIQKLLWHSSLETTQIYLTVLDNELKETQKLLHRN